MSNVHKGNAPGNAGACAGVWRFSLEIVALLRIRDVAAPTSLQDGETEYARGVYRCLGCPQALKDIVESRESPDGSRASREIVDEQVEHRALLGAYINNHLHSPREGATMVSWSGACGVKVFEGVCAYGTEQET